jgi:cysteine desulfurase/selenocysteine lyase
MNPQKEERIRKEFAHIDTLYFNTAYFGPSPYRAKQKVSNALFKELDPSFYAYNTWMGIPDRMRRQIASLLGVNKANIALCTSTAATMNDIANGFPFQTEGGSIAFIKDDYPSLAIPWLLAGKNRGVDVHQLVHPLPDADWLAENLPKDCRVFSISHVTFDTGKKIDIESIGKLLKERGIFFIVDATQSFGGMPITKEEIRYIDVLSCSTYKWCLGPYGTAFAYYSDEATKLIEHRYGNWINSINSKNVTDLLNYTTETLPGARKFDRGQAPNMLANACLEASLELLNEIGLEDVQKHNHSVRDYFLENYPKEKYELVTPIDSMANIVCIKSKGIDAIELERELRHNQVDVSIRQGNVRLSFHLFNTRGEVETLIRSLDI